ncbi:hypothetical protein GGR53DRAFT_526059 [Hypoxylon sp. FL1150]|nr:hypothetical protein GGR53DRAFT_526059 [Hypoxylon sp. FL1150]
MCIFAYPILRSKKNKKARKPATTSKATSNDQIQEVANESYPAMPYNVGAGGMPYNYNYYHPYGMEQWLEEDNRPAYITRSQWATHGDTLKGTLDAVQANGKKIDDAKDTLSGGIKDAHDTIKDTRTAVKGVHDTLKETCDALKKNHEECTVKRNECAAKIDKIQKQLEDEAKEREETYQRQQEAWNHYHIYRQAKQDAEAASTRSHSGSSRSGSSDRSHERRRRRHERELRQDFTDYFHPPWAWPHPMPPFPSQDDYYGGFGQRIPPKQPLNPMMPHGRGPRPYRRF